MTLILLLLLLLTIKVVADCAATNVGNTRDGRTVGRYAPDVTDESYTSHRLNHIRTEEAISRTILRFLAKPKAQRVRIIDHGPFNNQTLVCLSCNRSTVELYSNSVMPECNSAYSL